MDNPKFADIKYQSEQLWGKKLQQSAKLFFKTKEMKKAVKEAYKRNLLRRRTKEVFRLNVNRDKSVDYLIKFNKFTEGFENNLENFFKNV